MTDKENEINEALRSVLDPELGIDIVSLGLIYDVREEKGEVEVEMTLTSPGCPLAPIIDAKIKEAVKKVKGIKKLTVELVWDPPWTKENMSAEARAELGLD